MEKKSTKGVSRREFLKKAAAAGAVAAVVGVPRPGYVAGTDMLKIGLIGCGGRGTGAAEQALRAAAICEVPAQLVALADVLDRAKGVKRRFTESQNKAVREGSKIADEMIFDGVDAYKKLLATDVNYVILASHPGFRPMHFEGAVEAKKQIFTEKPVATDPVGMRQFMAAAKKSEELNLSVVAGTQRRHQANYVNTVGKIHEGAIGDILAIRAYWCGGGVYNQHQPKPEAMGDLEWQIRDWYAYCWICGDNIVEQHVHNLDVANWVMKAHPIRAYGSGGRAWKRKDDFLGNIWDNFSVDYEYPNGVHMLSMCRHWENDPVRGGVSEAFVGTKGKSSGSDMGNGGLEWAEPYTQEHVDLINSITGKGKHWNEAMQVAETTFTGILGRESAYQGRPLEWDRLLSSELSYLPKELSFQAKIPVAPVAHPGVPGWYKAHLDCL
jgi:predicted dehydrogenase